MLAAMDDDHNLFIWINIKQIKICLFYLLYHSYGENKCEFNL